MIHLGRTMFAPTVRVVDGADPYNIKSKYSQQPKQKIYAYSLFLLHIQAQKKKLSKRKRRKKISRSAERDKGDLPLTQPPFEKRRAKTLLQREKLLKSKKQRIQ